MVTKSVYADERESSQVSKSLVFAILRRVGHLVFRPSRRHLFAALLALAALVGAACNPVDTPADRAGRCQVGVVGDSLTVGARDFGSLSSKFSGQGCTVTAIDARVGRPTSEGASIIESWASQGSLPDILVVALGTNDCDPAGFLAQMQRIFLATGFTQPVVWVNTWRPGCHEGINDMLHRVQLLFNRLQPALGSLWIVDHEQWISQNRVLLAGDGIHLTGDGYRAYAERIVEAVLEAPYE